MTSLPLCPLQAASRREADNPFSLLCVDRLLEHILCCLHAGNRRHYFWTFVWMQNLANWPGAIGTFDSFVQSVQDSAETFRASCKNTNKGHPLNSITHPMGQAGWGFPAGQGTDNSHTCTCTHKTLIKTKDALPRPCRGQQKEPRNRVSRPQKLMAVPL